MGGLIDSDTGLAFGDGLQFQTEIGAEGLTIVTLEAPVNTGLPEITGTPEDGQTLSTSDGTWENNPTGFTYQWERDGSDIDGATNDTYVLTSADIGADITVTVTASNGAGSTPATSDAVGPVTIIFILDKLSASASSAFSVARRLRSAYAGALIRVGRSSDSAQSDFGSGEDELDVSALTTWINAAGASNAHIVTMYDQSGNSRNWSYPGGSLANAPLIALAGVVFTSINGKPTMETDNTNAKYLTCSANTNVTLAAAGYTMIALARADAGGSAANEWENPGLFGTTTSYPNVAFRSSPSNQVQTLTQNSVGGANIINSQSLAGYPATGVFGAWKDSNEVRVFATGVNSGSTAATDSSLPNALHFFRNNTARLDGAAVEAMTFASALSDADMNTLGDNMADFGGLSWTTVDWS